MISTPKTPNNDKKQINKSTTNNNISHSKVIHLMPCMKGKGERLLIGESNEKVSGDKLPVKREK